MRVVIHFYVITVMKNSVFVTFASVSAVVNVRTRLPVTAIVVVTQLATDAMMSFGTAVIVARQPVEHALRRTAGYTTTRRE